MQYTNILIFSVLIRVLSGIPPLREITFRRLTSWERDLNNLHVFGFFFLCFMIFILKTFLRSVFTHLICFNLFSFFFYYC